MLMVDIAAALMRQANCPLLSPGLGEPFRIQSRSGEEVRGVLDWVAAFLSRRVEGSYVPE